MIPGCTIIGTVAAQVAPTRAEDGCLTYDCHADANDPCVFVFYENWRTRQDLDEHLTKPHLKPLFDRQGDLLARPVEIRHLKMLSDVAS